MAEWPKAHDWKSCIPLKGIEGSNPSLSATLMDKHLFYHNKICKKNLKKG